MDFILKVVIAIVVGLIGLYVIIQIATALFFS